MSARLLLLRRPAALAALQPSARRALSISSTLRLKESSNGKPPLLPLPPWHRN